MLRIVFIIFLFGAAGPWLSCLTLYWIHFWFCSYTYINNHFYKKRKEHFLRTYMSKYAITLSSVLIDNFTLVVVQLLSRIQPFVSLQHTRLPCHSLSPRIFSNSCPFRQWCHPAISSSVVLFSSCLQSFPASVSFLISHFFTSGGQSIGASASASVLPMNIQNWFPLGWTGYISLQSKGFSRVFNTTVQNHQLFGAHLSSWSNSDIHTWLVEKP